MIEDAIALYHRLLQTEPDLARTSQQVLDEGMHAEGLFFGDRPLCSVLRPHMIEAGQYEQVRRACRLVIGATIKLGDAMLRDEALLEPLALSAEERQLVDVDPGYGAFSAISRLDGFFAPDGLHFIEYNAETPAGGAYTDVLTAVFRRMPVVQRFLSQGGYRLLTFDTRKSLTDLLLRCYREWGGRDTPAIAIVDWSGLPTASEFELCRRYFEAQGLPTIIVDPRELEYSHGTLRHGDHAITLAYKRVLVHELLQRRDEVQPLLQAYRDGKVCMVNSPRGKLFHKKAIFALLTDERYQAGFTPEEREAIGRHVPWTRRVADAKTTYGGETVDLIEFVRRHRQRFVLKPNDEYGGSGVAVGWEGSDTEWDAALQRALHGDYVVQERVNVARADFPSVVQGEVVMRELSIDMDPYIIDGEADGFLTRIARTTLLNVTAGGGSTVPTFVLAS
ncbi:MAG TPA: hypothetical protein VFE42_35045 [Chloroflexota bacterium]|nr:hypothetical protein [Chloroflexota bacterium]